MSPIDVEGTRAGEEKDEQVDRGRRTFLKVALGAGAASILAYLLWPTLQQYLRGEVKPTEVQEGGPATRTAPPTEGPAEAGGPAEGTGQEIQGLDLEGYPSDSPVGHPLPYLDLEVILSSIEFTPDGSAWRISTLLSCENRGGAPSTAVLEALVADEPLSFPYSLSSLKKLAHIPLYLSPGSAQPVSLQFVLPTEVIGLIFVLSDPLMDACPRSFSSMEELRAHWRHLKYYGK